VATASSGLLSDIYWRGDLKGLSLCSQHLGSIKFGLSGVRAPKFEDNLTLVLTHKLQ